jgi:hypothetical protein
VIDDLPGTGDYGPNDPEFESALAAGQFEFAKRRYLRTITAGSVSKMVAVADRSRKRLTAEIRHLQALARQRYESATDAARSYAAVLPHRVGKTWLQPPSPLERVGEFYGSQRLYKHAAKAAKEFSEAQDLLARKHEELATLERTLRERLDDAESELSRRLETDDGLRYALRQDPLLDAAFKKKLRSESQNAFESLTLAVETAAGERDERVR